MSTERLQVCGGLSGVTLTPAARADGWDALTEAEQNVAKLAAEGLTNSQIAAALRISPSTVKTHLGRVFRKMGVPNRTSLGAAVHRHGRAEDA